MKKIIITAITSLIVAVPVISLASGPQTPTCTLSATPSSIPNGVSTPITLHYTDGHADWIIFSGMGGGGLSAYGTSGNLTVSISSATRFEMFAIDLKTGNAHYCVASVSSYSNTPPL